MTDTENLNILRIEEKGSSIKTNLGESVNIKSVNIIKH